MADRPSAAEPNPKDNTDKIDLEKKVVDLTNENSRLIREAGELRKDNRLLAKQVEDYIRRLREGGLI
tara:strand:- start:505 stop:705 length:201 start_codon:yes stop_codon:yes gene_type:complete